MPIVYVGLGSNLGNRRRNILDAVNLLTECLGTLVHLSSLHETEPEGFQSDYLFLNAVAAFRTKLTPLKILEVTQQVEHQLGRTRKSHDGIHYDRTIDIDLIYMEGITLHSARLTLPHPRAAQRAFVLEPLREIAPAIAQELERSATAANI